MEIRKGVPPIPNSPGIGCSSQSDWELNLAGIHCFQSLFNFFLNSSLIYPRKD